MAEELFKTAGGQKQSEATKQEPAKSAEKAAEQNKETPAKTAEKPKEEQKAPEGNTGVPSLGSNSTASEPAPVVPVPTTVHVEPKQPTTETNLATTNVIAEDGTDDQDEDEDEAPQTIDEFGMLKQRAKMMGIKHSNNIGLDTLREMVRDALTKKAQENPEQKDANVFGEDPEKSARMPDGSKPAKKMSLRAHLQQEKMKLVRLRITNLDPKKKDLPGEILTVANRYLGTVRKYVPYGEVTDQGWHVPYVLYELLRDRKFLSIKTRKQNGRTIVEHQYVKEFALEILPPLTEAELARISASQLAHGID